MNRSKKIAFILGLGFMGGFYAITTIIFVFAFIRGGLITIIHTNVIGEATLECALALFSIPFVIFTAKVAIDRHKEESS